jgi:hypothetical protein
MIQTVDSKTLAFDATIQKHKNHVRHELSVLKGWDQNIKSNLAKIDLN